MAEFEEWAFEEFPHKTDPVDAYVFQSTTDDRMLVQVFDLRTFSWTDDEAVVPNLDACYSWLERAGFATDIVDLEDAARGQVFDLFDKWGMSHDLRPIDYVIDNVRNRVDGRTFRPDVVAEEAERYAVYEFDCIDSHGAAEAFMAHVVKVWESLHPDDDMRDLCDMRKEWGGKTFEEAEGDHMNRLWAGVKEHFRGDVYDHMLGLMD